MYVAKTMVTVQLIIAFVLRKKQGFSCHISYYMYLDSADVQADLRDLRHLYFKHKAGNFIVYIYMPVNSVTQ